MQTPPKLAYVELTLATVIIGSSVVVGKWTTEQMPVFFSQAASLAIALLALVPILAFRRGLSLRVTRKDVLLLIAQALLGMFLFRVFMLYGLRLVTASEAGIVTSLTPAVVAVLSYPLLRERLSWRGALGVLCALTGVASIRMFEWISAGHAAAAASALGLLLVFAAVVGEAMLLILRKLTASQVSSLAGTSYVILFSFLMFLPVAGAELRSFEIFSLGWRSWAVLAYNGLIITLLAYVLWFRGISRVPAGTAGVYTSIIPISTLVLSYTLLHEPLSWIHAFGCAFVLAGVALVSKRGTMKGSGKRQNAPRRRGEGRAVTDPSDPRYVRTENPPHA
ncbi:DMT family transporter [Cohnella sp. REN36]|uniref:DMT family transporter n=1 Tax=Cohnella sp. REN36 TaxID=2887347 RepID=UPI001D140CFD|nr:DMT family transporter [Cohnella sp. REN36]MCC3375399.1 DMT family transporter [Cohnella sp. REN36]